MAVKEKLRELLGVEGARSFSDDQIKTLLERYGRRPDRVERVVSDLCEVSFQKEKGARSRTKAPDDLGLDKWFDWFVNGQPLHFPVSL